MKSISISDSATPSTPFEPSGSNDGMGRSKTSELFCRVRRIGTKLSATSTVLACFGLVGCAVGVEATDEDLGIAELADTTIPATIRVHVVVTADDAANGVSPPFFVSNWTAAKIDTHIEELSNLFAPTGVRFEFDPVTDLETIRSTVLNNDYTGSESPGVVDRVNALARGDLAASHAGKLVLFFRDGKRQVAANFSGGRSNYVVLSKGEGSRTMMHEIGHTFHLSHTFPSGPQGDGITHAQAVEAIRAYVEDEGYPANQGLNALSRFDADDPRVADTPADIGIQVYRDLKREPCAADASLQLEVVFHHGGKQTYTYVPPRTNPMSYFFRCPTVTPAFSEGQRKVMRTALLKGNHMHLARGSAWHDGYLQALVTPIAVSRHKDTIAVYGTNDVGALGSKVWDASRGSYWPSNDSWTSLGGGGLEASSVISRRSDVIDLVSTRIGSGANVVNKVWSDARGAYWPSNTGWSDVAGTDDDAIGTLAAASRSSSTLDLFGRWFDGTIRARSFGSNGWTTPEWVNMGGEGVSGPAAISRLNTNQVEVFARWSDGTVRKNVWRTPFGGNGSSNATWENLGGRGVDSPAAVARRSDIVDMFVRWDDGTIRSKVWTASRQGWWPGPLDWLNLGGMATSKPVAVSRNASTILLATRWVDGTVRVKVWDDSRDAWWPSNSDWSNLGGNIVGAPVVVARGQDHLVVYARWVDGSIRTKVWNAGNSQWWPGQTSWMSLGNP